MNNQWNELKLKAMKTEYPRWRRVASTLLMGAIALITVVTIWYMFFFYQNMECLKTIIYLSVPWIIVQSVVIIYLFYATNIPAIVRESQKMIIGIGNIWMIFYVFSLNTCG